MYRNRIGRVVMLSLLAIAGLIGSALSADSGAGDVNKPHLRPVAVIPLMSKAPVIDGVIGEGEWSTLKVSRFVSQKGDLLQQREGMFWIGSDGTHLFIAARTAVHPTQGVLAKHEAVKGSKDVGDTIWDDSMEIWVDNTPGSNKGKYYQFMINSNGALFDKMHDRKDGTANMWYRTESWQQAHTVKDGIWTAEYAVKFADLEISGPAQEIGIRVCRNYKLPWDQSRWAPGVQAFDSAETMGRVHFVKSAPVVEELSFEGAKEIDVAVNLSNPTAAPLDLNVKLGFNAEAQPRYYNQDQSLTLAPGETRRVAYTVKHFSETSYPALAEIQVAGKDGGLFYHRDVKWMALNTETGWVKMGVKDAKEATSLKIEWHPTPRILRWRTEYAAFERKSEIKALRLRIVEEESGKVIHEESLPAPENFKATREIGLKELAAGRFLAQLFLDMEILAETPASEAIFDHATDFEWLNNTIGISDEVIPPFTPIEVKGDTLSVILREHTLTDLGLWKQVKANDRELLSAPIRLEERTAGKTTAATGAYTITSAGQNRVDTASTWTAGTVSGTMTSFLDYDGCQKFTLTLNPSPETEVEALDIVIPLRSGAAPLMHAAGDGLRINYAGPVPAGQGEVWSSKKASRINYLGTFLPYVFLGNETEGLSWFASNDRGWFIDEEEKTSALRLERNGEDLQLRVALIQKPSTWKEPREIVFGLMATPAKPLPTTPDYRFSWGGGPKEISFKGLLMCTYWGAELYSVWPINRDFTIIRKISDAIKLGKRDVPYLEKFMADNPWCKNEINWGVQPLTGKMADKPSAGFIIPYTNPRGEVTYTKEWQVYQDEWRREEFQSRRTDMTKKSGSIDFSLIPVKSRQDYMIYYYKKLLENGFDGIYWDNINIYTNANPVTGKGFRHPNGQFQPEGDLWELRELTRRTAVMVHQLGKPNCNMVHMTNGEFAPLFSWSTIYFDWEWKYGESDFQDRWFREYIRATSTGRHTGNVPVMINGHVTPKQTWIARTRAGVLLTHDLQSLQIFDRKDPYTAYRTVLTENGFLEGKIKIHHYWSESPVLTVKGIEHSWIVHEGESKVWIVLCDWSKDQGDYPVTLTPDLTALGIKEGASIINWEKPDETYVLEKGEVSLTIKQHDLRILEITR